MIVEVRALRNTSWRDSHWDYAIYFMLRSRHLILIHEPGRLTPTSLSDWPGRHMRPWASDPIPRSPL